MDANANFARAAGSELRVSLETFTGWFGSEFYDHGDIYQAIIAVVRMHTNSVQGERMALTIFEVGTAEVLFNMVIESEWGFEMMPTVWPRQRPECFWSVHHDAHGHSVYYALQFNSVDDRARFHELMKMGQDLAKAARDALLHSLTSTILALRCQTLPAYPVSVSPHISLGIPPSHLSTTLVDTGASPATTFSSYSPHTPPFGHADRLPEDYADALLVATPFTPDSTYIYDVYGSDSLYSTPTCAVAMDPPRDIVPIFATYAAVYSYLDGNCEAIDSRVKWEYCSVLVTVFEGPIRCLFVKQDACGFCGFPGKWITKDVLVEEDSLLSSQMDLEAFLNPLYQETDMAERLSKLDITLYRIIAVRKERNHALKTAIKVVNETLDRKEAIEDPYQKASRTLNIILQELGAQKVVQDDLLAVLTCHFELADGQPQALLTPKGEIVLVAELQRVLAEYDTLHSRLDALIKMIDERFDPMPLLELPPGLDRLRHLADAIRELATEEESKYADYLKYAGVQEMTASGREDLLRVLGEKNARYRKSALRELRRLADDLREQDWIAPLEKRILEAARVYEDSTTKYAEMARQVDLMLPQMTVATEAIYKQELTAIDDLLQASRRRMGYLRRKYKGIREHLALLLSKNVFEDLIKPLQEPLPARIRKRPLYHLMEQLRVLGQRRDRTVRKAAMICQYASAGGFELGQDDEMFALLEGLTVDVESTPSTLHAAGRQVPIHDLVRTVKRYRKIHAGFEVLEQLQAIAKVRLEDLVTAVTNGSE
ncbi:hypothetical protein C8T65DRAFT_746216 [Cerioporus squamosus]|nr:hypothetical protein C8T65DRAFT_746216 [Cerioporus squamosus]